MNFEERILDDVARLHERLDAMQHRSRVRHGWLKYVLHDLEYNPNTQYRVHISASYFWIVSAVPILIFFFAFPDEWLKYGVLITLIYSLYANFATDYGAASAALAAMGQAPLPEVPGKEFQPPCQD